MIAPADNPPIMRIVGDVDALPDSAIEALAALLLSCVEHTGESNQ